MVNSWSRRICIFGTFDAERHPRIAVIESGLVAHGYDVVRCNVPWAAPTVDRVRAMRNPFVGLRLLARLLRSWFELSRAVRQVPRVDVVISAYLGVLDIHLARRWWPTATHVLDHLAPAGGTVADRTGRRGLRHRAALLLDAAACRAADIVVVDTEEHLPASKGVVVPVGASAGWFGAAAERPDPRGGLRAVFFGLYTPLQGTPTIARASRALQEAGTLVELTLIGTGQDRPEVESLLAGVRGVHWVDWVEPYELPDVVAAHHVCLGIFGTTAKAGRVVPNKVFQGAAAGCAIVTSDSRPQRRLLSDGARFVPAGDPDALAAVLTELAEDPAGCQELGRAARQLAEQRFRADRVVAELVAELSAR